MKHKVRSGDATNSSTTVLFLVNAYMHLIENASRYS